MNMILTVLDHLTDKIILADTQEIFPVLEGLFSLSTAGCFPISCNVIVMSLSCPRCPQEDADAGIAFVQTSAQLISAGNAMSVDATGAVAAHRGSRGSPAAALDSQVMSVSADGRMHVEM